MLLASAALITTSAAHAITQPTPEMLQAAIAARAVMENKKAVQINVQETDNKEAIITVTAVIPKELINFAKAIAEEQVKQQATMAAGMQKILELGQKSTK